MSLLLLYAFIIEIIFIEREKDRRYVDFSDRPLPPPRYAPTLADFFARGEVLPFLLISHRIYFERIAALICIRYIIDPITRDSLLFVNELSRFCLTFNVENYPRCRDFTINFYIFVLETLDCEPKNH